MLHLRLKKKCGDAPKETIHEGNLVDSTDLRIDAVSSIRPVIAEIDGLTEKDIPFVYPAITIIEEVLIGDKLS